MAEEAEQAGGSLTGTRWWDSKEAVERSRSQLGAARSLQVRLDEVNVGETPTKAAAHTRTNGYCTLLGRHHRVHLAEEARILCMNLKTQNRTEREL